MLFLHPIGSAGSFWELALAEIGAMSPALALDANAPDLAGHGASVTSQDRIAGIARQLLADLDSQGRSPSVVVGASLGGLVALDLYRQAPEAVSALVLVDCVATYPASYKQDWEARADTARTLGLDSLVGGMTQMWFSDHTLHDRPDVVRRAQETFLSTDPSAYAATCFALSTADLTDTLANVAVPTLVLCGMDDLSVFKEAAMHIADAIPNASLAWIPQSRHAPPLDNPAAFASAVVGFASEIGA